MSQEVEALIERLSSGQAGAAALRTQFKQWRSDGASQASDLLDALAQQPASDVASLDMLLSLIDECSLARPAIARLLIDADDVADTEQATLAAVGLRVGQFEGRSKFTTWLHTIASNEAKTLIRSRERRPSTPVEAPEPSAFLARLSTMLANRDLIERAMAELPAQSRRVLELRERDGLEYSEIAEVLGVEIGTVRSRLSRARAMLVSQLEE